MSESKASSGGMGLASVLLVIFITLKVLKVEPVAGWSWLWVLSPFWIPLLLALGLLVGYFLVLLVVECFSSIGSWFTRRRKVNELMDE